MLKKLLATAAAASGLFVLTAQKPDAPPVFTAAQAEAGRKAFQDKGGTTAMPHAACAYCHTVALTGRNGDPGELPALSSLDPAVQKNIQDMGGRIPPLAGAKFMRVWGVKTTKDLVERIKLAAGPDEDTALNLVAYILQVNGAKSGDQALTGASAVEIRSVAPDR
jgi:cytochrome c553